MFCIPFKTSAPYEAIIDDACVESIFDIIAKRTNARRAAVITDETVSALYLNRIVYSAEKHGFRLHPIVLSCGESLKSLDGLKLIYSELMESSFTRSDICIALGGGVIGDLSGFAASTYMRGMRLIHVPTTLLAQIDSSVGGKTAINFAGTKNLIGTFYQPECTIILPEFLNTLPPREMRCGLGELIKYGAISSPDIITKIAAEQTISCEIIAQCCKIKSDFVSNDEKDTGLRHILNFGHTFGHAFEAASGYSLSHGECVGLGMLAAIKTGELLGITSDGVYAALKSTMLNLKMPTDYSEYAAEAARYIRNDKKAIDADRIDFVLIKRFGVPLRIPIHVKELAALLARSV